MFDLTFLVLNEEGNQQQKAKAILNFDYIMDQRNWPQQQLLPVLSYDLSDYQNCIKHTYKKTERNGFA